MRKGIGSEEDDREEVTLYIHVVTERAALVSDDGDDTNGVWLPRKFVDTADGRALVTGKHTILVPQWLLEKEGLC